MIINNLRNSMFSSKGWYILFIPLIFLSSKHKFIISKFAQKHWDKYPSAMHRLYWTCKN